MFITSYVYEHNIKHDKRKKNHFKTLHYPFFKISVEHTKENEMNKYVLNTQSKLNR